MNDLLALHGTKTYNLSTLNGINVKYMIYLLYILFKYNYDFYIVLKL